MSRRTMGFAFLGISVGLAGLGAWWVHGVLEAARRGADGAQQPRTLVEVVVAVHDIGPGQSLAAERLALRSLPPELVPADALTSADEAAGRAAVERILGGDVVREGRLAAPGTGDGVVVLVPTGFRALQVPVKGAAGMAGFVEPGNLVDVLAVCTETSPPAVRTLVRSVRAIGVGARTSVEEPSDVAQDRRSAAARPQPSVTLAVTPEQAETLKHAFDTCHLTLALVSDLEVGLADAVVEERP